MIATSGDMEVTNPDLVICHLDEGATLNMELTADIGKGYQPAAANRPADAPIGLIPVDAFYSPVRQGALDANQLCNYINRCLSWEYLMHVLASSLGFLAHGTHLRPGETGEDPR